jgi:DnaJ-class molecular chaperone
MKTNQWQVCPKCNGQGKVWFPPDMALHTTFISSGDPYKCDVCKGRKIISTITGLPPKKQIT